MNSKKRRNVHRFAVLGILAVFLFFTSLPLFAQSGSWKWIAYGDTRSHDNYHRSVLQSIMSNTPDYKFIINVGDVVEDGTNTSQWNIWQNACDDILGGTGQDAVPPKYMSAPGNHDNTERAAGLTNWNTYLSGQVQQYGNEGKFFVFDYENARFIVMDSDKSSETGAQYTMLLDAIKNNPKTWLFTVWHHPIFDFGDKHYEDDLHKTWGVPLYEAGCDIMFMGHAHYYVRTKKLALNGEINPPLDSLNGTVQVVTGNGGAGMDIPVPNHDNNGYMVEAYNTSTTEHGYTELTVGTDSLLLTHYLHDGTILDKEIFTPNKKTGSTNINFRTEVSEIPEKIELFQNYPNPFNSATSIKFHLAKSEQVKIEVFSILGQKVAVLINKTMPANYHEVKFNAQGLPSGIYVYR